MTLPEIEIIEFDGRQVEIRQAGQGPVLFLLHGIGSGSEAWLHQFPAFADRYRVIAWAAPGYGQSTDVTSDAPVPRDYAKVLDSLLKALGIDKAIFCGNSLGALFSGAFANLAPDRVRGLFLSDAARGHAHLEDADRLEKLRARLTPLETLGVERMAKERAGNLLSPNAPQALLDQVAAITARIRPIGYSRAAHALSVGDLIEELAWYDGPMAVVCGAEDRVTPPEGNRAIAASRPQASFSLIPDAGHLPYIETPDAFNVLLADFADAIGGSA